MSPTRTAKLLVLLLGGCGGADTAAWSASLDIGPATAETKLSVAAWRGTVVFGNGAPGRLELRVTGKAPLDLDKLMAGAVVRERDGVRIVIDEAAKDADLRIDIVAPPGIALACASADAAVDVSGSWSHVEVKTTGGAIHAHVERVGGGLLESRKGAVGFVASGAGPLADFAAKSISGSVAVTLPAKWNGVLHLATQAGTLDVPTHPNLRTLWDADKKGVVGVLGPRPENDAPRPTVWATSAKGDVSFRVGE